MIGAWLGLAWAAPDTPLVHPGETLVERKFTSVSSGTPPRGRGRNKVGPVVAWAFPDGTLASWYRLDKGKIKESRTYDGTGRLRVTVLWAEGRPAQANTPADPSPVDLTAWTPADLAPAALWGPGPSASGPADALRWDTPTGTLLVGWGPAGSPQDPAWVADLQRGCACMVEDRTAAWAHGVAGVKFRASFPHPAGGQIGELWAYPVQDRVLLLSYVTDDPGPAGAEAALAPGRIAASLIRWGVP